MQENKMLAMENHRLQHMSHAGLIFETLNHRTMDCQLWWFSCRRRELQDHWTTTSHWPSCLRRLWKEAQIRAIIRLGKKSAVPTASKQTVASTMLPCQDTDISLCLHTLTALKIQSAERYFPCSFRVDGEEIKMEDNPNPMGQGLFVKQEIIDSSDPRRITAERGNNPQETPQLSGGASS
ncbi:hypothetical protein Nepgr_032503 [Nepenthes gracilis]|uniref:Uncharacterized protein n=1 Tax=Nepenthes gracilis TaxID=150966 RepID=A0AAD3Y7Q7_NEPGR|nr:hypothetical protein Nepgr_032503 [Nepenthes gracilis]